MEKDFDIEKWRKEKPMDYIKAMELINQSLDKDATFSEIRKVVRLHVPDVLYKYHSLTNDTQLNDTKLNTLLDKKIFMSDAKSLNDPFDGKAFFCKTNELNDELKRIAPLTQKNNININIGDFINHFKIASFTSNGENCMPMWAHYSNDHNGFCVSYNMKNIENINLTLNAFVVQYVNKRIDITNLMIDMVTPVFKDIEQQIMEQQITQEKKGGATNDFDKRIMSFAVQLYFNLKDEFWSYENEFRCLISRCAEGMPYAPAHPKEIFIGLKCPQTYKEKLIEIARQLNISVYQMNFDEQSEDFNLISKLIEQ